MSFDQKSCLLDPLREQSHTYGDLWDAIWKDGNESRLVQTSDPWTAVIAIASWLVRGVPIILLDPDASPAEIQQAESAANPPYPRRSPAVPPPFPKSLSCWQNHCRTAPNASLALFTSGTTGTPKLVSHDRDSIARGIRWYGNPSPAIWGFCYHPLHMAGLQVTLQALANGQAMCNFFSADLQSVRRIIASHPFSNLAGTPSFFRLILPVPTPVKSVRTVSTGGEAMDGTLLERIRRAFPNARVRNIYASTEAGSLFISDSDWFHIPADLQGKVRLSGERLELHRSLLGEFSFGDGDGQWFDTGDRIEPHPDGSGRFRIPGREDGHCNVGGYRVDPEAVEQAILRVPEIRAAQVYVRPNPVLGNLLCVRCVGEPLSERDFRARLSEFLPPWQIPRKLEWVNESGLELTRTGKIRRNLSEGGST